MPIPTYDKFIEPILRYLAQHPEGATASTSYEAASEMLGVTEQDKLALLPSRTQPVYKNRAGWAHDRLKRAGLSSSPRRGYWKLTPAGLEYANSHAAPLTDYHVKQLAVADPSVRLRPVALDEHEQAEDHRDQAEFEGAVATPDDRLEKALTELREAAAEDFLDNWTRIS